MHEFFLPFWFCSFFFFLKNAYVYMKLDFFFIILILRECINDAWNLFFCFYFEWKCMFECINFDFLFFLKSAFMNAWNFLNFWMKMHAWMHELFLSFWFLFFLKNPFINAWNLFYFTVFLFWMKMHVWMHEILPRCEFFWFCSFLKNAYVCMKFFYWIFWMIMQVWMHEIWFFYSFWMMHAWNSWLNMNFENACLNAWNLMCFFEWCMHEIFNWIWILKMYVECVKFDFLFFFFFF